MTSRKARGTWSRQAHGTSSRKARGVWSRKAPGTSSRKAHGMSRRKARGMSRKLRGTPRRKLFGMSSRKPRGTSRRKAHGTSRRKPHGTSRRKAHGMSRRKLLGTSSRKSRGTSRRKPLGWAVGELFFLSVGCLEILARWRSLTIMLHQFRFQTMDWTFHRKIHGFLSILPLNHGLGPQFFGKNVVFPGSEKLWSISHNMNQYDLSFSRTTFGVPFFQTFKSGNTKLSFGPVQEWSWTGQSQDENSQASQRQCHHRSACETKPTDVLVRINMNKLILIEYFKHDLRRFQNHS